MWKEDYAGRELLGGWGGWLHGEGTTWGRDYTGKGLDWEGTT